jgi:hypothetical protein
MHAYLVTSDKTVLNLDGKILHFSGERFQKDIVDGDCCFMCGASPKSKVFNNEHVIPNWLLTEIGLHDQSVTLSNGKMLRYSSFVVPCCQSCNEFLGREIEEPISRILKGGFGAVVEHIKQEGPWRLFEWLNLIFLKTHLKDTQLRYHLDTRKGTERISDFYEWSGIHHIHCVSRARYTNAEIDPAIGGSFLCLSTAAAAKQQDFDYSDLVNSCAVFLRFKDVAFISILDDVGMAQTALLDGLLSKLRGPLSPIQLRELFGHFAYVRTRLTIPRFHTEFGGLRPKLTVTTPEGFNLSEHDPGRMGSMIAYLCQQDLQNHSGSQNTELIERLRKGEISFLTVDPPKAGETTAPA